MRAQLVAGARALGWLAVLLFAGAVALHGFTAGLHDWMPATLPEMGVWTALSVFTAGTTIVVLVGALWLFAQWVFLPQPCSAVDDDEDMPEW